MKALHISDTHGNLPPLPEGDYTIVLSGDFLPTAGRVQGRILPIREWEHQSAWVEENKQRLLDWAGDREVLWSRGNHDFYEPCEDLGWVDLDDSLHEVERGGLKFASWPYIPYIDGEWQGELHESVLRNLIGSIPDCTDVLVAHCPPYGILDMEQGQHFGSGALRSRLAAWQPRWILSGHIHASGGRIEQFGRCTVVNSATTMRMLDLSDTAS